MSNSNFLYSFPPHPHFHTIRNELTGHFHFTEELREHFGQFGDIESINVKTDPQTGRSRGFAFIVYTAPEAIEKVTAVPEHVINNKKVDPKKAKARHGKIFVGGLTSEISDEEIKTFFGQFGNVSFTAIHSPQMVF